MKPKELCSLLLWRLIWRLFCEQTVIISLLCASVTDVLRRILLLWRCYVRLLAFVGVQLVLSRKRSRCLHRLLCSSCGTASFHLCLHFFSPHLLMKCTKALTGWSVHLWPHLCFWFCFSVRPEGKRLPPFFPAWKIILFLYVWIQQRVQPSWTQTGTPARRQTASLSWPFTPTQTAVAAEVEVWEMVMPTARGAQGVSRIRTPTVRPAAALWCYSYHDAWNVTFSADEWLQWSLCSWWHKGWCTQARVSMDVSMCLWSVHLHTLVDWITQDCEILQLLQSKYPSIPAPLSWLDLLLSWWCSMLSLSACPVCATLMCTNVAYL